MNHKTSVVLHRNIGKDVLALTAGIGLGAGVMYVCDPDRGRSRRSRLMGEAAGLLHRDEGRLKKRGRDLLNRVRGIVVEAAAAVAPEEQPTDEVLVERARARLGHLVADPREIEVRARHGVVTLQGRLTHADRRRLREEVAAIHGVKRVVDRMGPRIGLSPGLLMGLAAGAALFRRTGKARAETDQGC